MTLEWGDIGRSGFLLKASNALLQHTIDIDLRNELMQSSEVGHLDVLPPEMLPPPQLS